MFFFDERYSTFEAFSLAHGMAILFLLILFVLILVFRHRISVKLDVFIRRSIAVLMVGLEWIFYAWALSRGPFDLSLLPLGVCAISMYVTAFTLWTNNEKVFQFIFPWALSGALISLVVADMHYTFPHFRYIHYFGNHGLFMLGNIYLYVVKKFTFNYRHLLRSSLILFVYAIIIYPVNILLGTNHLFLQEVPSEVAPMYAFLGKAWVLGFVFSIFLMFHVVYLPVWFHKRFGGNKNLVNT